MTDKQIITKSQMIMRIAELSANLEAKEQECEELKESLKLISTTLNHTLQWEVDLYKRQIDNSVPDDWEYEEVLVLVEEFIEKLKAENEELKKQIDDLLHKPEIQDKILWKIDNEKLLLSKDTWIYKLEQTLTEIKEIAEKIDDSSGCAYGDYDCDNCSSLEQETVCTYKVKKLILQKISEVEDVPSN